MNHFGNAVLQHAVMSKKYIFPILKYFEKIIITVKLF